MHEYEVEKKMKKVKKVVLYNRIGSDKYGTAQLDIQESITRDFAERHGLEVVHSFKEISNGYLGQWSRPVLREALDTARGEKNCVVAVSDISRLSKRAMLIMSLMEENTAKFISVANGIYYKTMPLQMTALMNQENYKTKCLENGTELLRDTLEGRITFARHMKPLLQMLLDSGKTVDDLEEMLGICGRRFVKNIDDSWWWSREDIDEVLKLG